MDSSSKSKNNSQGLIWRLNTVKIKRTNLELGRKKRLLRKIKRRSD